MLNKKQRQMNLKFLNFYKGIIDGIEGTKTKQAYKDFQKAYNLTVDGIYGVKTDNKLVETIKYIQGKIGANTDGIAGNETINKCKEYQSKNGLAVDGICGANTRAKINELTWDNIKHFKKEEFTCKCGCGTNNIDLKLVKILDEIRDYFGQPVVISSGCRCKKHNAKVGGVQGSRHVLGKAADIIVRNVSKDKVLAKCKECVASGRARYTYTNNANMGNAVHIDIN